LHPVQRRSAVLQDIVLGGSHCHRVAVLAFGRAEPESCVGELQADHAAEDHREERHPNERRAFALRENSDRGHANHADPRPGGVRGTDRKRPQRELTSSPRVDSSGEPAVARDD